MTGVAVDKVKVLLVGDSGVGKSSLTRLICHGDVHGRPGWTIGASVDVKLHEFRDGTPSQKTYAIELWDIGGSSAHKPARPVFYHGVNGIILVHDLTNRKSGVNLQKWLAEVLNKEYTNEEFDPETFVGSQQIPILVIGTKQDLVAETRAGRSLPIAEECGADEIAVSCTQPKTLAPGSSSAVKLSRFFDKVIERRYHISAPTYQSADRHRRMNFKSLHMD